MTELNPAGTSPGPPVAPPTVDAPDAFAYAQPVYQRPKGLSIAALILGILGILLAAQSMYLLLAGALGFFMSIAAIIAGHIAARRQPYARAMWLTGLITGYTGLVAAIAISIYLLVILIAFFANPGNFSG